MVSYESLDEKINVLRSAINRYFDDFSGEWNRETIERHEITVEELMSTLKRWDQLGYIQIVDTPDCFFKTLKSIPENWRKL